MDYFDTTMDRRMPLPTSTLDQVASYILADPSPPPSIIVLAGAGISTSTGIPDFRSPKIGLYDNLARFNLESPTDVFDINFFRSNPQPFFSLAAELYPGRYAPTISHAFVALLARKGLLAMLFTQNIDGLEKAAGVPAHLVVEAHGSFDSQRCIDCTLKFPGAEMRAHVAAASIPRCGSCGGLVKPDIVFFGEQLPERFFRAREAHLPDLDAELVAAPSKGATWPRQVMIVMGTSLSVPPFCELPGRVGDGVPRVLFNREVVGDFGERAQDVVELGDCDSGVRKLAEMLGWGEELEVEWRRVVGNEEAERQLVRAAATAAAQGNSVMNDASSLDGSETSDSISEDDDELMSEDDDEIRHDEANEFTSSSLGAAATPLTLDSVHYSPLIEQMVPLSSSLTSISLAADISCAPTVEEELIDSLGNHADFVVHPSRIHHGQSTASSSNSQDPWNLALLSHQPTESDPNAVGLMARNPRNDAVIENINNSNASTEVGEMSKPAGTFQITESGLQPDGNIILDPISMFTWHDDPGFWDGL